MKCFYHSADLDGQCSGAIVKKKYPYCKMIGVDYGQSLSWWETIKSDEIVFMVDFSLQPFSLMEKLNKMCRLVWIDHHKSAIDEAYKKGFIASGGQSLETDKAACELTWEYLYPHKQMPISVHLLGRYDVWDLSAKNVLPFQYGMRLNKDTSPNNIELWKKYLTTNSYVNKTIEDGNIIIKYETSRNAKFCKKYVFETEFQGLKAVCANQGMSNSSLFDSVYDPKIHSLMITFCRLPVAKWTVSLYSTKDNVDCGEIAKSFGGGGHKGAAGFQCEQLPFSI